jgi:hypothetical protein
MFTTTMDLLVSGLEFLGRLDLRVMMELLELLELMGLLSRIQTLRGFLLQEILLEI